jgi:hypothetical protein
MVSNTIPSGDLKRRKDENVAGHGWMRDAAQLFDVSDIAPPSLSQQPL